MFVILKWPNKFNASKLLRHRNKGLNCLFYLKIVRYVYCLFGILPTHVFIPPNAQS